MEDIFEIFYNKPINIINYTRHKLLEGFTITSDEIIKPNDVVLSTVSNTIVRFTDPRFFSDGTYFKIVIHQDQIDFSTLSKEEQKEIGWFDKLKLIKQFAEEGSWQCPISYELGFQKAQELMSNKMFTLEDMKKAYKEGALDMLQANNNTTIDMLFDLKIKCKESYMLENWGEFIESLSQSKSWRIEGEWIDNKLKIIKLL